MYSAFQKTACSNPEDQKTKSLKYNFQKTCVSDLISFVTRYRICSFPSYFSFLSFEIFLKSSPDCFFFACTPTFPGFLFSTPHSPYFLIKKGWKFCFAFLRFPMDVPWKTALMALHPRIGLFLTRILLCFSLHHRFLFFRFLLKRMWFLFSCFCLHSSNFDSFILSSQRSNIPFSSFLPCPLSGIFPSLLFCESTF